MSANSFMNGGSKKSLTHEMLANLFKGCSAISLLPYSPTGVAWAGLDFGDADQIYTLKDSFQISQSDPTVTEIQIDQMSETIDSDTEKGDWTFTGNIPSLAAEILEVFYQSGAFVGNRVVAYENTARSQTSLKIKKGSGISGATTLTNGTITLTVSAINKNNADYDVLTVSSTSADIKKGDTFYKDADVIIGQDGSKYAGRAFFSTSKEIYATMLVENEAKTSAIAFAKVKMTVGMSKDDATNPAYLKMTGTILANDESTGQQGDWVSALKV